MSVLLALAVLLAVLSSAGFLLLASRRLAATRRQLAALELRLRGEVAPADQVTGPAQSTVAREAAPRPPGPSAEASNVRPPEPTATVEFLHAVNHDLRAPLAAVLGYQELLADGVMGPLGEKATEAVGRIGTAAFQLQQLLDAYFAVAYANAGAPALKSRAVPFAHVLNEALTAAAAVAAEYNTTLAVELPAEMPYLQTDPRLLERTLELVLGAATRASPGADLRLTGSADAEHVSLELTGAAATLAPNAQPEPVNVRLALAARLLQLLGGALLRTRDDDQNGSVTIRLTIRSMPASGE